MLQLQDDATTDRSWPDLFLLSFLLLTLTLSLSVTNAALGSVGKAVREAQLFGVPDTLILHVCLIGDQAGPTLCFNLVWIHLRQPYLHP